MASESHHEPEFYPIRHVLIAGPEADAVALADRAANAGHSPVLLLSDGESRDLSHGYPVLSEAGDSEHAFDVVVDLHCVDLDAKADALLRLESVSSGETPLLTLCNSVSLSEVVMLLERPGRAIGVCILPPFKDSRLAEIVSLPCTEHRALQISRRFCESIGLQPLEIQDSPGGVLVRTVCCLVNEAALAQQDRIAGAGEIDLAMRLGVNYPHGPLEWARQIGIEQVLAVMNALHDEFGEERYRATPALKRLVRAEKTIPVK